MATTKEILKKFSKFAIIIAEAITIYQKTKLTPREMEEQWKKFLGAVQEYPILNKFRGKHGFDLAGFSIAYDVWVTKYRQVYKHKSD